MINIVAVFVNHGVEALGCGADSCCLLVMGSNPSPHVELMPLSFFQGGRFFGQYAVGFNEAHVPPGGGGGSITSALATLAGRTGGLNCMCKFCCGPEGHEG